MTRWLLTPVLVVASTASAAACPFCTAVKPSLSQRLLDVQQAALVEVTSDGKHAWRFQIKKPLVGAEHFAKSGALSLSARELTEGSALKAGQLALLMATASPETQQLSWEAMPLDEVSFAYIARAPQRRLPAAERLGYYARFLEHANPFLAEDAYLEFGNASYDDVTLVASQLPMAGLRQWIVDPAVPEARKGFYGLALGLATTEEERRANREVLQKLIDAPADDFRAGFDGVLGGYLVLAGSDGLRYLDEKLLANPQARTGDLRHAATALRFMHEFGRDQIAPQELSAAMRRMLVRPEVAAAAIVDLARWQDWGALDAVVALFTRQGFADAATAQAIVGYLKACPRPAADESLAKLRRLDPQRVAAAEQAGLLLPATR